MREMRAELTAHVGGAPTATQRALIDRLCWLGLHIALMDRRTAEGRQITERDAREYLAWSNSHGRLLRQLGLKAATTMPKTLAQHLAEAGTGAAE